MGAFAAPPGDTSVLKALVAYPHDPMSAFYEQSEPDGDAVPNRQRVSAPAGPLAWLTASAGVSGLADGMVKLATPLYVVHVSDDARLVAGAEVAIALPWLLAGPLTGAISDRFDRRRCLQAGNLVRAVALLVAVAGIIAGTLPIPVLYVLLVLHGTGETLYENAAQAIVPEVVDRADLDRANGRLFATMSTSQQIGGQALGGLLFGLAVAVPFATAFVLFAVAALLLTAVRPVRPPERETAGGGYRRLGGDVVEGLRWLWGHRLLRVLAIVGGTANFVFGGVFAVLVLLARQRLGVGSTGYGVMLAVGAVGALAGGLIAARVVRVVGRRPILAGWIAVQAVVWTLVAASTSPYAVGALLTVGWCTAAVATVVTTSLRQELVPDELLGRVTSVFRLLSFGSMPLGALCAGFLVAAAGTTAPYWTAAVLLAVLALLTAPVVLRETAGR